MRSAVTGAYLWNTDKTGGNGSFAGLSRSTLLRELPAADPNIKAVSVNGGAGYCVEDTNGPYSSDYIGGLATPLGGLEDRCGAGGKLPHSDGGCRPLDLIAVGRDRAG